MTARLNLFEHLPRPAGVFAGGDVIGGRDAIEQMMRDSSSFGDGWLRRANIELAVHGDGIAVYNFAVEALCESERQSSFAAGCGTEYNHQRRCRLRRSH